MKRFLDAVGVLTLIPVPGRTLVEPGRAAVFFPLVGGLLGAAGAGLYWLCLRGWPAEVGAALVVAFWMAVTGALHEDGLARVADAFRPGRTPSRILAILDSRGVGASGAVALIVAVLVRWQALAALAGSGVPLLRVMVASLAVSRGAVVALAWLARPAGGGSGAGFGATLGSGAAVLALAQAYAAALWCGPRTAALVVLAAGLIVLGARGYFERRLGGVNGDCLGAVSPLVECAVLLIALWAVNI